MTSKSLTVATVAALLACGPAQSRVAADVTRCPDAVDMVAINACLQAAVDSVDARVETLVDSARRVAAAAATVDSSQAAWSNYRVVHCRVQSAGYELGSMRTLAAAACMEELGRERAQLLARWLSDPSP